MGSMCVHCSDDEYTSNGKAVMHQKPFQVINALLPWPLAFWRQNHGGTTLTYWEPVCKVWWRYVWKDISYVLKTIFSNRFIVTSTLWPQNHEGTPLTLGGLFLNEHMWKRKAVMHQKPFSVINALLPCPLTPKSIGHIPGSWGVYVCSFMMLVSLPFSLFNTLWPLKATSGNYGWCIMILDVRKKQ